MSEIQMLLNKTYMECVNYFLSKYGNVPGDYFLNDTFRSYNSKIKRGKEGLYIHHIDEDKAIMLSTKRWALTNPFEYQKANRLVYCNLLEHLLLHIKIFEFPNPKSNPKEECGVGGIYNFLVPDLNDIYSGIVFKVIWKQTAAQIVLPLKEDYFKCISKLVELNFPYPLKTSFNTQFGAWNTKNNKTIYKKLKKLGVKL